jgi:hypothetical protein
MDMADPPFLSPAVPPPLTPDQLQQLAAARAAAGKIQRVASVAAFDGWTIAIFAALSFICGIGGVTGPVMGAAMGTIAGIELMGVPKLRRLDSRAARTLGYNQLAFASLLVLYAVWSLWGEYHGQGMLASLSASDPSVRDMLKDYEPMMRMIALAVYGSLIVAVIAAQGGMALYYFTRAKRIEQYVRQTPAWIIQMQQAVAG